MDQQRPETSKGASGAAYWQNIYYFAMFAHRAIDVHPSG